MTDTAITGGLTREHLQSFCSTDSYRRNLQQPFSQGGHTFATNRIILVRVPEMDGIEERSNAPDVISLFNKFFDIEGARHLNKVALPDQTVKDEPCIACDGRGVEYECPDCDGKGRVDVNSDEGVSLSIDGTSFALKYVRMLYTLPNVRIKVNVNDPLGPTSFAFDGGDGLIMPMRIQHPKHLEIKP